MSFGVERSAADRKISGLCEVQIWRSLIETVNQMDTVGSQGFGKAIHWTVGMVVDAAREDG